MINFIIPGEPVIKKNNRTIFRHGSRPFIGKSQKLRQTEDTLKLFFITTYKGPPLAGNIGEEVTFYMGTKRRKDISNCLEIFNDAMQAGGVIKDDSQIVEITMHKRYDKDNPRVVIEVYEL